MTDSSISNYIRLPPTSTNREFLAFIEHAKKVKTIAVDTESTGKEIRDDRGWAMGLSISYEITDDVVASCYFPLRHKSDNLDREIWDALKVLLSAYPGTIVFHNSKFDLTSLLTLGIDVMGTFWDTMLMAHMVNENIKSKALDYLAQTYLKDSGKERSVAMNLFIKDGLGWEWAPPLLIWDYACHDTEMTYRLYKKLYAEMESQDLIDLWPVEQKFVRVIREMESRGVKIDKEHCARELIKGSMAMSNIIGELGYDPAKPTDMAKLFFDKLKLPVVKTTPGGKPSFDKFAMEMYDELLADSDNPTAQRVLEYRGWQKTLTSNYRPYLELISPDASRSMLLGWA